jgi:two-component system, sensor histidine kinase
MVRALETETGRARVPILALTANTMSHHLEEYTAAGMDGCIAKPIDAETLMEALVSALEPELSV